MLINLLKELNQLIKLINLMKLINMNINQYFHMIPLWKPPIKLPLWSYPWSYPLTLELPVELPVDLVDPLQVPSLLQPHRIFIKNRHPEQRCL